MIVRKIHVWYGTQHEYREELIERDLERSEHFVFLSGTTVDDEPAPLGITIREHMRRFFA